MRNFINILFSFVLSLGFFVSPYSVAKTAESEIVDTLKNYIEGSSFSDQAKLSLAFNPHADLFLSKESQPIWKVPANDYIAWFKEKNKGTFNGRIGEILHIDVSGDIATAKVEIIAPSTKSRFIDVFLLKKVNQQWQILSKAAVQEASQQKGERILFILSNAHFHGNTKLVAGASFGEIVNAYDTFKQAGYTVDFVSPEGGAIPLSYIDTSDPMHKKHLYNADFMYALKHSKTPEQVEAKNYRAVHYIGGSNAMYGVAQNAALNKISMEIYEQYNGIVSSVCHGTAGIVNLKTKDGKYLVEGKQITGYPEDFEREGAEYFKQFPFLIKKTITDRKGIFHFGASDQSFVKVDGRVVTGQNHQSSAQVAKEMIKILCSKN